MLDIIKNAARSIQQNKQDLDSLESLTQLKLSVAENLLNGNYDENYKLYEKLGQLEHSLYRYNEFNRAGLADEAKREAENFMNISQSPDGAILLKGGISTRYVWHTEDGACDKCQALDGEVFETQEDIPARLHPNCKCQAERLPDDKKNDEPCDCWGILENLDSAIKEGENLSAEIEDSIAQIQNTANEYSILNSEYARALINDLISLEQPYITLMQTISNFVTNFIEMKDAATKYADKYFHAKANCEAAQSGILGEILAQALSDLREFTDSFRNIKEKHLSIEASLKDIEEDQEANREGRDLGHWHPLIDAYDLLKHRIPNGFPERYKKK